MVGWKGVLCVELWTGGFVMLPTNKQFVIV